jgi:hypothetical protein
MAEDVVVVDSVADAPKPKEGDLKSGVALVLGSWAVCVLAVFVIVKYTK